MTSCQSSTHYHNINLEQTQGKQRMSNGEHFVSLSLRLHSNALGFCFHHTCTLTSSSYWSIFTSIFLEDISSHAAVSFFRSTVLTAHRQAQRCGLLYTASHTTELIINSFRFFLFLWVFSFFKLL